jgi:hypothetical protein
MGSSKGPVRKGVWVRIPPRALLATVRHWRDDTNVRSFEEVDSVRELVERGLNDCAIARLTQLPRSTVRDWRNSQRWMPRLPIPGISRRRAPSSACPVCDGPLHDLWALPDSYAYLLGLYLGDGCLSEARRGVFKLRIALDGLYPGIIRECVAAMRDVLPNNRQLVQSINGSRGVEVNTQSKQLRCLFPQHAPGRKHERRIALAEWQQDIVTRHPDLLLRGLIHSDGCRFTNTIHHPRKTYAYPRYCFSNRSDDIRRIFCDACDLLGIEWRVMNRWNISVARGSAVARLDEFVGPKA